VAGEGFVVTPGSAPRYGGPQGREADFTDHIHKAEDEFFYVVSGEFSIKVGDRIVSAPADSFFFVPRGTPHTFRNVGMQPGVILVGVVPGGFEKMFEERQGVDAETNQALMKKHNVEAVGPPLG
jgi:uncharacterized RmlC-like cupin family protein